jgi:hypothetical protein
LQPDFTRTAHWGVRPEVGAFERTQMFISALRHPAVLAYLCVYRARKESKREGSEGGVAPYYVTPASASPVCWLRSTSHTRCMSARLLSLTSRPAQRTCRHTAAVAVVHTGVQPHPCSAHSAQGRAL